MRTAWLSSVACLALACSASSGKHGSATDAASGGAGAAGKSAADSGTAGSSGIGGGTAGSSGIGGGSTVVLPAAGSSAAGSGGGTPACVALQCQQRVCSGGGSTTISGHVYDPAGKNPLYNIVVYVPNAAVQPLKSGASCDQCNELYTGRPIASAVTDATGKFTLKNAPDGKSIPLVLQVGKWRKQLTLPSVKPCQDNPQPDGSLTLPRNHMEGDIPNIAISTGGADTLECLLARIGVDGTEYMPGSGTQGRIHIFQGSPTGSGANAAPNTTPAAPLSSMALWDKREDLMPYDILLLSCEGAETKGMNQQALHDYASAGGRVFASHFHYSWFNSGPYGMENLAMWTTGSNAIGAINATIVTKLPSGKDFPKGVALHTWLDTVTALTNDELPITQARHNAEVTAANTPSQAWIVADQNAHNPGTTEYFSFNTPTDAKAKPDGTQYCGRVVYSDLHVGAASGDIPTMAVPMECANADLSPQEKALEFMLFDLSSCVIPDSKPPVAPPVLVPQ
ncbi:MAG TPA: carboxypeptidase regulatory-like domain-containing protein [Polyangiales bacterium]